MEHGNLNRGKTFLKKNSWQNLLKPNYLSKIENESIRQSWEWETDFEQSFLFDIGKEESLTKILVNRSETAREPKRFATLSNEELVKILEEKHSVKTEQITNWSVATFKGRFTS